MCGVDTFIYLSKNATGVYTSNVQYIPMPSNNSNNGGISPSSQYAVTRNFHPKSLSQTRQNLAPKQFLQELMIVPGARPPILPSIS